MQVIQARNVEEALIQGSRIVSTIGEKRDSRNGPVLVMPYPVTTVYHNPRERVMFLEARDANPFFHLMESLWMVAGRNDVDWLSQFNSNIANYSDDGVTFHGAYGHRWREFFTVQDNEGNVGIIDQLATIAKLLKDNPDDRRIVLQMWSASADLGRDGKDFPCNLICNFRINPYGFLDMTVFNRSNDMIWGAYGANAVHFSFLQEVMAAWIGVPVGKYWQISTNFHAYLDTLERHGSVQSLNLGDTPYEKGEVEPFNIVNTPIENWMADLDMFMDQGPVPGFKDVFFRKVASPMMLSWRAWKNSEDPNRKANAIAEAKRIGASDWRKACVEWLERRN